MPPVLVADDCSDDVYFLRRSLITAGVRNPIIGVASGEELLAFLRSATFGGLIPNLLFLDLRMPGMDGFETLRAIRGHPTLHHLRVIIMTGSADALDRERAAELGADAYVIKYPSPAELKTLIASVTELASAVA